MNDADRGERLRERVWRALRYLWIGAVNPGPPPLPGVVCYLCREPMECMETEPGVTVHRCPCGFVVSIQRSPIRGRRKS